MSNSDILAQQLAACGGASQQANSDLSGWGFAHSGAAMSTYAQTMSAYSTLKAKERELRKKKARLLVRRRNARFGKKRQWGKKLQLVERSIDNTRAKIRFLQSQLASMPKPMAAPLPTTPAPHVFRGKASAHPMMSSARKVRIRGLKRQIRNTQHALSRNQHPAHRAALKANLASLKKQLATELALSSAARRATAPRRISSSQGAQRKAKRITLNKEIKATRAEIKRMHALSRMARMSPAAHSRLAQLKARLKMLQKERAALASGGIILRRRRVSAGSVPYQKPILRPRPGLQELTEREVEMLATALASRIPRRPGETRAQYLLRLRAYMRRASLRYGNERAVAVEMAQTGKAVSTPETAVAVAVTETLTQDTPALEAEADQNVEVASGGEEMDENLDDLNEVVEDIAESANPEAMLNEADEATGEAPPVAEALDSLDVEELLAVADEATDSEIEVEDIVESSNGALLSLEEDGEWYEDPKILLGGAAIALAILVLKK